MRRPRRSTADVPRLRVAVVVGMVLGMGVGFTRGTVFQAPEALDRDRWRITSPTLDETVASPNLGRGTHVVGGALVIREQAFHAAATVTPLTKSPPARLSIELEPGSDPLMMMMETSEAGPKASVQVTETHYATLDGRWHARDDSGPWTLRSDASGVYLEQQSEPVKLSGAPMEAIQLTALSGEPKVTHIELWASDGSVLFVDAFDQGNAVAVRLLVGGLLGALWGLALGLTATTGSLGWPLLLGTLPLWTLAARDRTWLYLLERAYLVRTPYWELARTALLLTTLPLVLLVVVRRSELALRAVTHRLRQKEALLGMVGMGVAGVLASRDGLDCPWWMHVVGWCTLWAGPGMARALRLDARAIGLGEVPVLLGLAVLKWPLGLPVLVVWRGMRIAASARYFLDHAPRVGVNLLWISLLGAAVAAELGVRASYLNEVWRSDFQTTESASDADWRDAHHSWRGQCGGESREVKRVVRVGWAGGSSTGGAFQFEGEPTVFFPAQVHAQLCASLPPGVRLETFNYGHGARDTFTISRTITGLLRDPPLDLLVLYVGVNDVLTDSGGYTRKQREEMRLRAVEVGASRFLGTSRVLTGLGMMVQNRQTRIEGGPFVPEVPLEDARDNIEQVARAASGTTRVVLMAELLRTTVDGSLEDYSRMLDEVAASYDHVETIDLESLLNGQPLSALMADRNHFNRAGSAQVGAVLAPQVAHRLGLPASEAPSADPSSFTGAQ